MSAAVWYYAQSGKRLGPVSLEQIRSLAASGELRREDLVWTAGMSQWSPAGTVRELMTPAAPVSSASSPSAPPIAPAVAVDTGPVGYYTPGGGIPSRAAATLAGYAKPTGDTGDWPLDDARVEQFDRTCKLRKKISAAGRLYGALLALSLVGAGFIVLAGGLAMMAGPRSMRGFTGMGLGLIFALIGAFCALYFFTWRATMRARRWAPLTMLIIYVVGIAINALGIALSAAN